MKPPLQPGQDLEAWARTTLRQLPDRSAPGTLAVAVMERIRRQQGMPWYQRPWTEWPAEPRWVTALGALVLFGVLLWAWRSAGWTLPAFIPDGLTVAASALAHLLGAFWLVLRHLGDTTLLLGLGVLATVWCTTLGLGTTCWRLATPPR